MKLIDLVARTAGFGLNALSLINGNLCGRYGFWLFCKPVRLKLSDFQRKYLLEAEDFSVQQNEETIKGYRWGKGEKKILLMHGWQSHTFRWKRTIDMLVKEGYSVYAFDAPGHGMSGGKFLNLILYKDAMRLLFEKADGFDGVIGHSLGGLTTLYALKHDEKIKVEKVILMGVPGEVHEFITFYGNFAGLTKRTLKQVRNYFLEYTGHLPEYFSAQNFAEDLSAKGLIIHDVEDADAPYHHAVSINKAWKNSTLLTTKGEGHALKSDKVLEDIHQFLKN